MKVEVITCMFNEEFLAPFFMGHYSWVDKAKVFIDMDTTDNTESIVRKFPNAEVYKFQFPDMMNDLLKVNFLNDAYHSSRADWVILVDADEFVFRAMNPDIRNYLEMEYADVIVSTLYQVYRHKTDKDLDVTKPAVPQRRHGIANTGVDERAGFDLSLYNKPIVARGGLMIEWTAGNHFITDGSGARYHQAGTITNGGVKISQHLLDGAHWAMADPCFCIERRCKGRRDRQSKFNLANGMTIQHHGITEEDVRAECEAHLHDKKIIMED